MFCLCRINTLVDLRGLFGQELSDRYALGVEWFVWFDIPNLVNCLTGDLFVIHLAAGSNFTGEDHVASLAQHFAGDVALRVLFDVRVQNGVGDQVANFVRVSFGNGF